MSPANRKHVAIVTGAANGIGRAITTSFLSAGISVAAVDRDAAGLQALTQCEGASKDALVTVEADILVSDTPKRVAEQVLQQFGSIDILVNNAGGSIGNGSITAPVTDWSSTLNLNLTSHFLFCQAVVPAMIAQGFGRIINVASNAGKFRSNTGSSGLSYATAKGGVIQMTRSLAHALGRHGITVNALAPGSVLTGPGIKEAADMPVALKSRVLRETPLGYFAAPEEMASAVRFLASTDASYVTGVTLLANGGWCTV